VRWTAALLLLSIPVAFADDREKAEKKALEQQAQAFVKEAKDLEKAGKLLEARTRYANSQSFAETKDATGAIKRIDGEIQKRVKSALQQAHRLYDQGKFEPAAQTLEDASKLGGSGSVFSYDLALCKRRMGETASALAHLDQAAIATADPKRKLKIKQLRTALVTGEQTSALKNDDRDRINKVNQLMESIGFETSVEDRQTSLTQPAEAGLAVVPASLRSGVSPVATHTSKAARRSVSLCQALDGLKGTLATTPAMTFNLANCAEDTDRPADAAQLLGRYLEAAPHAADAERVRLRIARLNALVELPEQKGAQVRGLYASASRFLEERKYDGALADFQQAADAAPEFAPTAWRLALMYEAMGKVDQARKSFTLYRQLETNPAGQQEADLHLDTLDAKRGKYDEEIERATEILSDLFNRAMNLTFNGLEDRASQYKQRARERAKVYAKQKLRVGRMLKGVCLVQERRQAMRTTLVSVLAVLAQWGIPANAQPQAGALPAWSAAPNGYWVHPPTKRLFFFMSDPKNIGRPPVFGQPAHAPGTGGFFRPFSITGPIPQNPPPSNPEISLDGPPTAGKSAPAGFPEIPQA
jgi:tetratricopeptide (TPR) repeat protein